MDGSVHLPERQDLSDGVLLVRLVVGLLHLVLGEVLLVGGDGDLVFFDGLVRVLDKSFVARLRIQDTNKAIK